MNRNWQLLLISFFLLATTTASVAQVPWPEKAKNLKVLPANTSQAQLRQTMFAFSNALGVNCIHCHVAGEFNDWSTYDFAADDKPTKRIARVMFKMVDYINNDAMSEVSEIRERSVDVSCMTCHRGNTTPKSLQQTLAEVIEAEGIRAGIREYHRLKERYQHGMAFDFSEAPLNLLGYQLMGENKLDEAIEIFKLNVEEYPNNFNPYDSLAEAFMKNGQLRLAEIYYSKSLALNPENDNALQMLEQLEGEQK